MKITWLGQAGLMFETRGKTILVDPYLSDSVAKIEPKNVRRVPVKEDLLSIRPDVVLCTHDHLDHIDPETLDHYLKTPGCLVLAHNVFDHGIKVDAVPAQADDVRHDSAKRDQIDMCQNIAQALVIPRNCLIQYQDIE